MNMHHTYKDSIEQKPNVLNQKFLTDTLVPYTTVVCFCKNRQVKGKGNLFIKFCIAAYIVQSCNNQHKSTLRERVLDRKLNA